MSSYVLPMMSAAISLAALFVSYSTLRRLVVAEIKMGVGNRADSSLLPTGEPLPAIDLLDSAGLVTDVHTLRGGRQAVVAFLSSNCQKCSEDRDRLEAWTSDPVLAEASIIVVEISLGVDDLTVDRYCPAAGEDSVRRDLSFSISPYYFVTDENGVLVESTWDLQQIETVVEARTRSHPAEIG